MANILEDEQLILDAVSYYGSLLDIQLIKYLKHKEREVSERILAGLKKRNYLFTKEHGYVAVDQRAKHDIKMIKAFWVMLQYIDKLDFRQHYPSNYPGQIYFICEQKEYEVMVIDEGELHLVKLYKQQLYDDQKTTIIVVPNKDMIEELPDLDCPTLYATINNSAEVPDIMFYSLQ